jgi:hypothetical protein
MRHYQEFFWLPSDTIMWLRRVVPDRSQAIVQTLSTGGIKRWNHMLVGKSLGECKGLRLRQSLDADRVVFEARSLRDLQKQVSDTQFPTFRMASPSR